MHGQVAWFFAGEDSASVDAGEVVGIGNAATVADQASGCCELPTEKNRWYGVPHSYRGENCAFAEEKRVAAGDHESDGPLGQSSDGFVEFVRRARLQYLQLQSK